MPQSSHGCWARASITGPAGVRDGLWSTSAETRLARTMSITGSQTTRFATALAVTLLLVVAALVAPAAGQAPDDDGSGGTSTDAPTGTTTIDSAAYGTAAELSVAISRELPADADVTEVLIARDDDFADALASGGMQGTRPLLLVPGQESLPRVVADEISRLGVDRAVVLGGTAAVGEQIVADLGAMDVQVERVFGPDRISTAVEIAGHMGASDTVILARAYGSTDNPTQAFADALAAGAMGAETGWPILLTDSGVLSSRTRELIADGVEQVYIVGGTAAVGSAVEDQVEELSAATRIAGPNRFGTAVEIAKTTAEVVADTTSDSGWTLIEGTREGAWTAGFAVASVAAARNSPVLLATPDALPTETEAHLIESRTPDRDQPIICIVSAETCELGRRGAGLPPAPIVQVRPGNGATVDAGANVLIAVDPIDLASRRTLEVDGCLAAATDDGTGAVEIDDGGNVVLQVPPYGTREFCDSTLRVTFANGESTTVSRSWVRPDGLDSGDPNPGTDPSANPPGGTVAVHVVPVVTDLRPVPYPVVLRSATSCDRYPAAGGPSNRVVLAGQLPLDAATGQAVAVAPWSTMRASEEVEATATCTISLSADSDGVTITTWAMHPADDPTTVLATGSGPEITADIAALGTDHDPLQVTAAVQVAETAAIDTSWPAPARDTIRVWKRDALARVFCLNGADETAAVYLDLPAGTTCTVSGVAGSPNALVMALGVPLTVRSQTRVDAVRDRGPIAVWGDTAEVPAADEPPPSDDDPPPLPPGDDCPGFPEDPTYNPGIDIIPDCPR